MIHQLLKLERPFFVLDTETTGTDVHNDRIIELGSEQWGPEGLVGDGRMLFDGDVASSAEALSKHHITEAMRKACRMCGGFKNTEGPFCTCEEFVPWPTFARAAPPLAKKFSNCDFGGKNVRFDLQILQAEFTRANVEWSINGARIIDAERLEQIAEPRSLSHLYKKYTGNALDHAHAALADVKGTTAVICGQLEVYTEALPRDLNKLHALQFGDMIDLSGKFRFRNKVACFSNWGKYAGKPMKSADNGYWDFILNGTFAADVKQLARDAKLGKFPVQR